MVSTAIIELKDVNKSYEMGTVRVPVLHNIDLRIAPGEFMAIVGPSGSGKSTLLNILGCLDSFDDGHYQLGDQQVTKLDQTALAGLRNQRFGFVFQQFSLVPRLSALRNVELPLMYAGINRRTRRERALQLLDSVGLADRQTHSPMQLSGGQQQRVAVARALANDPDVIIADEPTGALDSQTGDEVLQLFADLAARGKTVLIVTHDSQVAERTRRIVRLADGKIVSDSWQ
ncbi:MAG: ABC transporter ATP-binding protein [Burkholderiaceae bacterium]